MVGPVLRKGYYFNSCHQMQEGREDFVCRRHSEGKRYAASGNHDIPARTMAKNASACKLAPPTKAPSTSAWESKTLALSGLTLPPYWMMSAWGWTLSVSALALLVALVVGSLIGIARTAPNKALVAFGEAWTELFRNIPLLVQIFIWYHVVPELFPVLKQMLNRRGGDLSGGQQQQLAIARALAAGPKILILDEPTEGIQPSIIKDIGRVIRMLADRGDMAIVLVEQYYDFAQDLADDYVVMERGAVLARGKGQNMEVDGVRALVAI